MNILDIFCEVSFKRFVIIQKYQKDNQGNQPEPKSLCKPCFAILRHEFFASRCLTACNPVADGKELSPTVKHFADPADV